MDDARSASEPGLIERRVEAAGGPAGAESVFAPPVERGGVTVIPVARVRWGAGGGRGWSPDQGEGSGGGAGAMADPVGYIEVTEQGAVFRPIERRGTDSLGLDEARRGSSKGAQPASEDRG